MLKLKKEKSSQRLDEFTFSTGNSMYDTFFNIMGDLEFMGVSVSCNIISWTQQTTSNHILYNIVTPTVSSLKLIIRGNWQTDVPVWGVFLCIYSSSCTRLENLLLWLHFNLWNIDIRARYTDAYWPFYILWVDFILTPGILAGRCHGNYTVCEEGNIQDSLVEEISVVAQRTFTNLVFFDSS